MTLITKYDYFLKHKTLGKMISKNKIFLSSKEKQKKKKKINFQKKFIKIKKKIEIQTKFHSINQLCQKEQN